MSDNIAWAAGFVDGEGCISYPTRTRSRNRHDYNLHLYVGQVDPRPLNVLRDMFGGSVVLRKPGAIGRRRIYMWRISGTRAEMALRALRDHLIVKREQADIAIELRERIRAYRRPGGRSVDPAETEARQALLARLRHAKWRDFGEEVMP